MNKVIFNLPDGIEVKPRTQAELYNSAKVPSADGYECGECGNKQFIAYDNPDGTMSTKKCSCWDIRANIRMTKESGLETEFDSKTFDNYIANTTWQRYLKEKAIEYCREGGDRWFYIGGQCGSGKTHLCTAICSHFLKRNKTVKYMEWLSESKKLKALANDVQYTELVNKYKHYDVLYIDDFMKVKKGEKPTGADISIAFDILNSRLRDRTKITIISSEFCLSRLLEIDDGTMSRINERAKPYIYEIQQDTNKNYRLKE